MKNNLLWQLHVKMQDAYFEYDWIIDGLEAGICVDQELIEVAPDRERPTLITVSCMPRGVSGSQMGNGDTKRAFRLADALLDKLGEAVYAGHIVHSDSVQLYIYAGGDCQRADVAAICESSAKRIIAVPTLEYDPTWQVYRTLLYPDSAKRQTAANRELANRLRKHGDNNSRARRVNLHFYFATEQAMVDFTQEARAAGFAIGIPRFEPERGFAYGIVLHKISTLLPEEINSVTSTAIYLAENFGGELVDLDCQLAYKGNLLK